MALSPYGTVGQAPASLVARWRRMAREGLTAPEIVRRAGAGYRASQVHHAVRGHTRVDVNDTEKPVRAGERFGAGEHRHNTWLNGERSPNHKLTAELVQLLLDHRHLPASVFARIAGVSRSTVSAVRRGRDWAWIPHPNRGGAFPTRGGWWSKPERQEVLDAIVDTWPKDKAKAKRMMAKLERELVGDPLSRLR